MVVTVIGAVFLFSVLVFSLLRFTTAMDAFVTWFLDVIGIKAAAPKQEQLRTSTASTSSKENSNLKTIKPQESVKKKTEEPVFSTNLPTPIEDVIKETVKEDLKSQNVQPSTPKKIVKPKTSPNTGKEVSSPKTAETTKSDKSPKKKVPSKPKDDSTQPSKVVEAELPVDDIGFSFFHVKEKSKSSKKNKDTGSLIIEQSSKKRKEHLQVTPETTFVASKKSVNVLESQRLTVPKFPVEAKQGREFKKVCSSISYASVVTNNIPEAKDNSDVNVNIEEDQKDSLTQSDKRLEEDCLTVQLSLVNKEINKENIDDTIKADIQPGTGKELKSAKFDDRSYFEKASKSPGKETESSSIVTTNLENLSKSASSSIEVICEEQNTEFQKDYLKISYFFKESQIQFEVIEGNLNKLVQSASERDHASCRSDSSSICVIDNQAESVEPEIGKREETETFLVGESERSFQSTTNSTEDRSFNLDTFFVEEGSEQNSYTEIVDNKLDLQDNFASESTCQDCIEKIVAECLDEVNEQFEAREKELEENSILNHTYSKEESSYINDIVEELQKLENSETLSPETDSEQISILPEFVEETREEPIVKKSEFENQGVDEPVYLFEDSNIDENPEETEQFVVDNTGSLFSQQIYRRSIEIKKNNTRRNGTNEELQRTNEQSKLDSEEIQQSLNNLQIVEDVSKSLHLETKEFSLNKTEEIDIENEKTEEFLQLEKGDETENRRHFEEIRNNLNNTQIVEGKIEMASAQVRVLTLNDKEHQECTLYRIEKNWSIQFRLGPSLFGRKVYLYCNYPLNNKGTLAEFNRDQYQLLNWVLDEGCKNADDTALYIQIVAKLGGSFHYYFTFEKGDNAERQGSGFFLVDPILKYGNDEDLPLDCIQCQTVLAKGLGSFSTWERKLQVAKESGYNMIHFTPIQELGISNSCYSLSEQLKLNPDFKKENGKMPTFEEIRKFIGKIRKDWKVTSICDIVLNHTANESEWIKVHPEVTYNCVNCPYMRPAYLLDAAFHQFSMDVKKGLYEDKGIPIEVDHEDHLNAIRYHFRKSVLEPLKIEELFICDTSKLAAKFFGLARGSSPVTLNFKAEQEELRILQDKEYKRLAGTVDLKLALKLYNIYRNDTFDEDSRLKKCTEEFKSKLDSLNNAIIVDVNDNLTAAVENVIAGIRYFRVQPDGPKVKEITIKNPLVYRYFTDYGTPKSIKEHEEIMYSSNGRFLMAHNGWVMNSDPLKNFAAPDSNVYLRRELIAWGDSVKLRYGEEPRDCPFLWEHMKKYVEQIAEIFDGVRLDNCHSTPIPVAEYLLDCARRVRPDLYVVAELFTNSDMTDNIFVNRLGITSLIREAMSAWDSHEEGRLVYRYGGSPVGSFYQPRIRPLVPSIAHALFLDLTHDNPSPVEKRSVFDLLPSAALVNMACCASGSNRGYDELVPHHIHVVDETRQYTEWTDDENLAMGDLRYVTKKSGIILAKKAINDIHFTLGKEGYNQVYVDQMDPDIVAVTRHRPDTHESYILVAFTAFGHPSGDAGNYQRGIRPLRFEGVLDEIVLEATLSHVSVKTGGSKFARWENFVRDSKWVNGLSEYQVALKQHIQANESDIFEKVDSGTPNVTQLNFKNFKPGSVVVIKASLPETMKDAVNSVRSLISQFSITKETELSRIIDKLTLADLNRIIYRCDQEERDEGFGFDAYNIPNFGSLVYAGLQGFISLLANIRPNNDLGHPMCSNLRDGNWMIEYIWKRLKLDINTCQLGQWIEENTKFFNNIPRYLVPSYFDVVVTGIYVLLMEQSYKLMSNFVNHGSTFVRGLSLGSVQFAAYIKSADLPVLSPNLAPPKPSTRKNDKGESVQACVTLSAGLPHFSVGYMRNWGRDTFIALRGLFILTGRFEEARQHILGYAACLRHGLIPNLLDGGRNSRFNCRDAVWWWLYCIKEYAEEAPNGINILADKVSRIFPTDDSPAQPPGAVDQPLYDVMQEALKVHFQGLNFRERNAGRQIDEHMTDRGFNNQIGIHPETGFVFGGNRWNCGTWMDKMGSSDKAGNRGKPATPRDGSAVELIGLSKAVITWLWKLNQNKKYPYNGVERTHKNGSVTKWTFKEWSDKIQANFEKYFWVNGTPVPEEYRSDLINKRGIYKDSFGASEEWADFQLRCNFPIAMVAAPELFTPQQAWTALKQAEKYLLGPLGMKTLDPEDWTYHGDYDNSNDSTDPSVAHGFNYHQGPEWVWPVGFFLRAKLHFASLNGLLNETIASTKVVLSKHFTELQSSVWRGLPELTNSNGSYCSDSSRTQAWSMACILEVLHDLQRIESNQPVLIN